MTALFDHLAEQGLVDEGFTAEALFLSLAGCGGFGGPLEAG